MTKLATTPQRDQGLGAELELAGFVAEEGATTVTEEQVRQFDAQAKEQRLAGLADEFPYLAEVVAGHVAKVGYDFADAFEYGLDLILGLTFTTRGGGTVDIAYHATVLPLLLVMLAVLLRPPAPARSVQASG